jgi:hypothetical protein
MSAETTVVAEGIKCGSCGIEMHVDDPCYFGTLGYHAMMCKFCYQNLPAGKRAGYMRSEVQEEDMKLPPDVESPFLEDADEEFIVESTLATLIDDFLWGDCHSCRLIRFGAMVGTLAYATLVLVFK